MEISELRSSYPILQVYKNNLPPSEYNILELWLSTFFRFQLNWILDASPLAAYIKSRQIGISHSTAAVAVLWAVFHGETTTVISIGQLESTEVLEKVKGHTAVLQKLGSKFATIKRDPANMIVYDHGGRVIALPSSGGRSFSGNVFLDEVAYSLDFDSMWDAAMGGTIHEGRKARVVSTPNGIGDGFHNLITNPIANQGWTIHETTIEQAIADGMQVDVDKCWALAKGDARLFAQMFQCKFLDNQEQYIPSEYVDKAQLDDPSAPINSGGVCYGGLDIGSSTDPTVLWILKKVGNVKYTQLVKRWKTTTDDDIDLAVKIAIDDYGCKKFCIDKTGLGEIPAKKQEARYPRIVVPIDFTQKSKETLATGMYSSLSKQELYIPKDKSVKNQFCSIKRIKSDVTGNIKYDSPRGKNTGHADDFWSCALANMAASQPNRLAGVKLVRSSRGNAARGTT